MTDTEKLQSLLVALNEAAYAAARIARKMGHAYSLPLNRLADDTDRMVDGRPLRAGVVA